MIFSPPINPELKPSRSVCRKFRFLSYTPLRDTPSVWLMMNTRYYDLRREIVKAERRIAVLTERGEMWAQYNEYKTVHKQLARVKPEKRELFEQRHSRELILYDAAARYLKELKDSGEGITPKAWQREIDQLTAGKQTDTLAMKSMREDLKSVERLRKTAEQLSRQERDKSHDRGLER